uniref:Putative secreted protein n=1 Tax=Anopheles marajoara TaxID=58244 RepID=A0A2M4C7J8_9DIPT
MRLQCVCSAPVGCLLCLIDLTLLHGPPRAAPLIEGSSTLSKTTVHGTSVECEWLTATAGNRHRVTGVQQIIGTEDERFDFVIVVKIIVHRQITVAAVQRIRIAPMYDVWGLVKLVQLVHATKVCSR